MHIHPLANGFLFLWTNPTDSVQVCGQLSWLANQEHQQPVSKPCGRSFGTAGRCSVEKESLLQLMESQSVLKSADSSVDLRLE